MTPRGFAVVIGGLALALPLTACGDSTTEDPVDAATTTDGEPTVASTGDSATSSTTVTGSAACDRVMPAELSEAFDVTFEAGREVAEGQCVYESDAAPQFRLTVYAGASTACEAVDDELETVQIAGNPGWWDEAGGQARACLPNESIAATLYGGGGDNSVHRAAMLDLVATAVGR